MKGGKSSFECCKKDIVYEGGKSSFENYRIVIVYEGGLEWMRTKSSLEL